MDDVEWGLQRAAVHVQQLDSVLQVGHAEVPQVARRNELLPRRCWSARTPCSSSSATLRSTSPAASARSAAQCR